MTELDYSNFDLEIHEGAGREYPVEADSPAGETAATMSFPYDELTLDSRLKDLQIALLRSGGQRRASLSSEEQSVQDFGQNLFDALFTGQVRGLYHSSLERVAALEKGLRVRLRIHPPELAALPWEFLYDSRQAEYVCLSRYTPIVRYLEMPLPIEPLTVTPPLRILGMIASPQDQERLDVGREKQRIEAAIRDLQSNGLVELTWLPGQTWRDLQRAMWGGPWHIFHFIGHGDFDRSAGEGRIALADDTEARRTRFLRATELGRLLAGHRDLRLALLNSCEGALGSQRDILSSTAAILARRGMPAVLAMQYEITDQAAIEFARVFYEALAYGMPVDAAVAAGRTAVSVAVANSVEWGTPVLYMRSEDGHILDIERGDDRAPQRIGATGRSPDAQPEALQPPDHPQRSLVEFDWVAIPAGPFLMGSNPALDRDAARDEQPQHPVEVPEFRITRGPVTNAQYKAFVDASGQALPEHWEGGRIPAGKENHPVVCMSWHDAQSFCTWAKVRLPTEAEWEKAARGVDARIWPWGNDEPDQTRCNFNRNLEDTTPTGQYPAGASPYGVLDMSGNVWEWVSSLYRDYRYRSDDDRENPAAPGYRVLRGGSLLSQRDAVRCANRAAHPPDDRVDSHGFRVAALES